MTFSNNQIVLMVISDKNIMSYITTNIQPQYRDDFKQNLCLMILESNNSKLNSAVRDNYLTYLVIRIIKNTMSDTSPFWKEMKNSGQPKSKKTIELNFNINIEGGEYDLEEDMKIERWREMVDDKLRGMHFYYAELFNLWRSGMTYRQIESATGISYQSVRLGILKALGEIKKDLGNGKEN